MKFVRFATDNSISYGVLEGDQVRAISGSPLSDYTFTGAFRPVAEVRLLAPCEPKTIYAMAGNYLDHLGGKPAPPEPKPFLKVPGSVIAPGDTIVLPAGQPRVDEEGELVVVMRSACRKATPETALDHVFGYTCGNDVSAREWQANDLNWWRAKSSDTFTPLGPCVVTGLDPSDLTVRARINGKEVQRCNTRDFIFSVAELICFLSASVTLQAGDLIFTGTTGEPAALHDGDTVEIEIDGIGILRNPVAG